MAPQADTTDGRRRAGAQTRASLLGAATRLLAEHGESGLTLRAVSDAAGANVAAVKYHFGSREALVVDVVDAATRRVADAQLAALGLLEQRNDPPTAAEWVEAWSRPLIEVAIARADEDQYLGRILGRTFAAPSTTVDVQIRRAASEPSARMIDGLARAMPHADRAELRLRLALMASALAGLASGAFDPVLSQAEPGRSLGSRILDRMIAIATA